MYRLLRDPRLCVFGPTIPISMPAANFEVDALYAALDEARRVRGLSWQQLAREVSAQFDRTGSRPIAGSTLSGMRSKRVIEGDGVLQTLRWLNRTPESFIPGHQPSPDETLPHVEPDRILRFD